jgi:hypothetical protein
MTPYRASAAAAPIADVSARSPPAHRADRRGHAAARLLSAAAGCGSTRRRWRACSPTACAWTSLVLHTGGGALGSGPPTADAGILCLRCGSGARARLQRHPRAWSCDSCRHHGMWLGRRRARRHRSATKRSPRAKAPRRRRPSRRRPSRARSSRRGLAEPRRRLPRRHPAHLLVALMAPSAPPRSCAAPLPARRPGARTARDRLDRSCTTAWTCRGVWLDLPARSPAERPPPCATGGRD